MNATATRLQNAHRWLTKNQDHPDYAAQLDRYWRMEDALRADGYQGCVWQPRERCPPQSSLWCLACSPYYAYRETA